METKSVEKQYQRQLMNLSSKIVGVDTKIINQIMKTELYARKQDVADWQAGRDIAEYVTNPDNTVLQRVFKDVAVDAHLTGIINAIKNKIKARKFKIKDKSGKEKEDLTDIFEQEWFFDFIDYVIESNFYWYSIIQLGDFDKEKGFNQMELVPREYCIPQKGFIKKDLYINDPQKTSGWYYGSDELKNFFIPVISKTRLGYLDTCAAHALAKKHLLIYLWRYAEIFGMPWRVGKTDTKDPVRRKNMEKALDNAGNSMSMTLDKNDLIELMNPSASGSGAIGVFIEPMKFSNNEMSKAIAGAAGFFDEKNFVGSAESGERLFEELITASLRQIYFIVNNQLIPRLVEGYKQTDFSNTYFEWDHEQKVDYDQQLLTVATLLPYYSISPEEIMEYFGLVVGAKVNPLITGQEPESLVDKLKAIKEFYNLKSNGSKNKG